MHGMLRSVLKSTSSKGTISDSERTKSKSPGFAGALFQRRRREGSCLPATWTSQRPSSLPLGSGRYLAGSCSIEETDQQLGLLAQRAVSRDKSREPTIHFSCTINTFNDLLLQTLTVLSVPTRKAWCSVRAHPAEQKKDPAKARRADKTNARISSI